MDLAGKVAGITGAGSGFGKEMALLFADEGADLSLCDIDEDGLADTANLVRNKGRKVTTSVFDVATEDDLTSFVDMIPEDFGKIDIWVGNAGIGGPGSATEISADAWHKVVGINQSAVFFGARAAGRHMLQKGSGSVINIASMYGLRAVRNRVAYCTTKAAVVMISNVLAVEWAESGVRVNSVAPGYAETPLFKGSRDEEDVAAQINEVPARRLINTKEVAQACLYLASDRSSGVTGHCLSIDGGWSTVGGA